MGPDNDSHKYPLLNGIIYKSGVVNHSVMLLGHACEETLFHHQMFLRFHFDEVWHSLSHLAMLP